MTVTAPVSTPTQATTSDIGGLFDLAVDGKAR